MKLIYFILWRKYRNDISTQIFALCWIRTTIIFFKMAFGTLNEQYMPVKVITSQTSSAFKYWLGALISDLKKKKSEQLFPYFHCFRVCFLKHVDNVWCDTLKIFHGLYIEMPCVVRIQRQVLQMWGSLNEFWGFLWHEWPAAQVQETVIPNFCYALVYLSL